MSLRHPLLQATVSGSPSPRLGTSLEPFTREPTRPWLRQWLGGSAVRLGAKPVGAFLLLVTGSGVATDLTQAFVRGVQHASLAAFARRCRLV